MIGEYTYNFLKSSEEIYDRTCRIDKGYCYHKKVKHRVPCLECGKGTFSISGRCPKHIRSFYVGRHYQKYYKGTKNKGTKI